ncbi:MAG: hypothetical protein HPY71_10250 [Firmicutes bacterium]|nr:hypothetical protein [Bacillota bacterium]
MRNNSNSQKLDKIKDLMERVNYLVESDENKRRLEKWESVAGLPNIFTRHLPKKGLSTVPFIADLDREMWGQVMGIEIERIYQDPYAYVEFELSKKIFAFENFKDDNPITKYITMWFGVGFVESLLGIEQEPARAGHEPWVGKGILFKEREDLKRFELPDFQRSEPALRVRRVYSQLKEIVGDEFEVIFPEWDFGPFGTALHLRGTENLLIDFLEAPEFVHDLIRLIMDAKFSWSKARAEFLGVSVQPLYLANDDINVPLISPEAYKEFILPYEKEISEFHGGIDYWHSCGRIDPVLHYIKEIPKLKMIHISPWTDLEKAIEIIGTDHIIEVVLNPIDDVEKATPSQMESKLKEIKRLCEGLNYTIRADAFQIESSLENDLKQITTWIEKAREVLQ